MTKRNKFKKSYKCGIESEVYKNTPHEKKVEKPIEDIIEALNERKKSGNDISDVEKNKEKMEKGIDELVKIALENTMKKEKQEKQTLKNPRLQIMLALKKANTKSF